LKAKPPDCSCQNSPFKYSPAGHVIAGDFSIIDNESLRKILAKGSKYHEPVHKFEIQLQTSHGQNEKKEVDTLSELVKAVRSLIQIRIGKTKKVNEHKSNICI
jgi:hypothetical protein